MSQRANTLCDERLITAPVAAAVQTTVSVIVPCYNYGHFLEDCVRSVLAQEGVDVELLIVDDCSTDASAETAHRLAARDDRIELRRHSSNAGLIATANEGLEWAQGDLVMLLSADDMLAPGALERAATVMREHPNVGLVYGRPQLAREDRPLPEASGRWRATKIWPGEEWIRLRCRAGRNCIFSPEAVVRTSVQHAVGLYDPICHHTSDLNMWLRVAAVSDVAHIRGVPQATYRIHADSMVYGGRQPAIDMRERRAAFDTFFETSASQLDGSAQLQELAARSLAREALRQAIRELERGVETSVVDDMVLFALAVHPNADRLPEWRALRLRRWIGGGRSRLFLPFIATRAIQRARRRVNWTRMISRGI
jgi:glycosyltransferase involved in cell wall biosynthesis